MRGLIEKLLNKMSIFLSLKKVIKLIKYDRLWDYR